MSELIVVGSLNMDLVVQPPHFPAPGETIQGGNLATYPGGKGANQAVAASKLQLDVAMLGKVGGDPFGEELIHTLTGEGVDTSAVQVLSQSATGTAIIIVNQKGENMIVLSPGANAELRPEDIDQAQDLFEKAHILLMQFEVPMDTVHHAAQVAKGYGMQVIVNPAPGREISPEHYTWIDVLVPNETELSQISGREVRDLATAKMAGREVLDKGLSAVIVTLGSQGALLVSNAGERHYPARLVKVVDTTAAGDSFIGGLVSAIRSGYAWEDAVNFANCAGALATTKVGAQPSLPTYDEVYNLYKKGNSN